MTQPPQPGKHYRPSSLGLKAWPVERGTLIASDSKPSQVMDNNAYGIPDGPWYLFKEKVGGSTWYLAPEMVDPEEVLVLDLATGIFSMEGV